MTEEQGKKPGAGRPVIAIGKQEGARSEPPRLPPQRWSAAMLAQAPHRISFFLAMVVLIASGIWWALVQLDRSTGAALLPYGMPPMLGHSIVMCFGFFPLFFAGFLFTAGPKWLHVEPPNMSAILPPLLMQAFGWLLWLVGAMSFQSIAMVALGIAWLGFTWMCAIYWGLVRRSRMEDRIHAKAIAVACAVGCVSLAAAGLGLLTGRIDITRAFVLTAVWGFVGVVYIVVAHRMIPFFTSSALPFIDVWRPFWVLWLLLAAMAVRVADAWISTYLLSGSLHTAWSIVCGSFELVAGGMLMWLAYRWGLVQSLKNHLLAMLHIGFSWIGIAFVIAGGVKWISLFMPVSGWELAALHAFTMGALGSLLLAMVTRVSCGHSGRMLHADSVVWGLFCLLQATVVMRVAAALGGGLGAWLLSGAALLWVVIVAIWGGRLCSWYGKPRADGRPG
ncbi:NnrS family protein [Diaphorobacter ruginosibacter]|uniref:NnrS family protein n=1 Tax=Diaphorobacter ruginosibacter TaxID=1715720 RepID=UPI003342904F